MSLWDFMKDIAKASLETLQPLEDSSVDNNSVNSKDIPQHIDEAISSHKVNSIMNFPRMEIILRKNRGKNNLFKKVKIEEFRARYKNESLQKKIAAMSNQERAYLYYFLGYKHYEISKLNNKKVEQGLAIKYLNRALKLCPDNRDFANELFKACNSDNSIYERKRREEPYFANLNTNFSDNKVICEDSQKGEKAFNQGDYEEAVIKYGIALRDDKMNLDSHFNYLLATDMFNNDYTDGELDSSYYPIAACEKKDDFNYLAYFCTLYGDVNIFCSYEKEKISTEYYGIAVFLLDMLPVKERFAAPYYKFARYLEQKRLYKEALKRFEQVKEIDPFCGVEDDIARVKRAIEEGEESNRQEAIKHINLIKQYKEKGLFKKVLEECKETLKYLPNHIEVMFNYSEAAEKLSMYYEMKWATMEGFRLTLVDEEQKNDHFWDFTLKLARCCRIENKKNQACVLYESITDIDTYNCDIKEIAQKEYYECLR